jgi:hypothetical protein
VTRETLPDDTQPINPDGGESGIAAALPPIPAGSVRRVRLDPPQLPGCQCRRRVLFLPTAARRELPALSPLHEELCGIADRLAGGQPPNERELRLLRRTRRRRPWLLWISGVAWIETQAGPVIHYAGDDQVRLGDRATFLPALMAQLRRIEEAVSLGVDFGEAGLDEAESLRLLAEVRDHRPDILGGAGLVWVEPRNGRPGWFDSIECSGECCGADEA